MAIRDLVLGAAMLAMTGCHPQALHPHGGAKPEASNHQTGAGGETVDLQGGADHWKRSSHLHAFYDLTKATFADGADKVDLPAYQEKSYAIFRAFGAANGGDPDAMVDHLKDIPRQLVGIVRDDPKVLESYDSFWVALQGPP